MSDLILGGFHCMDWLRCEAFVVSAQRWCPSARVMAVGLIHPSTASRLMAAGCEVFEHDFLLDYALLTAHHNNIRWWLFADALRRTKATRVFITDTRDVVFQGDIFEHAPKRGILVPMEGRTVRGTSGTPQWTNFMQHRIPDVDLETVWDWEMSCCGTMLGHVDDMMWYLHRQMRESMNWFQAMPQIGLNMPIHNWLVHHAAPDRFVRTGMEDGVIATLSWGTPMDIEYDAVKHFTVLHQYDLRPRVRQEVYRWSLGLNDDPQRWSLAPYEMVKQPWIDQHIS